MVRGKIPHVLYSRVKSATIYGLSLGEVAKSAVTVDNEEPKLTFASSEDIPTGFVVGNTFYVSIKNVVLQNSYKIIGIADEIVDFSPVPGSAVLSTVWDDVLSIFYYFTEAMPFNDVNVQHSRLFGATATPDSSRGKNLPPFKKGDSDVWKSARCAAATLYTEYRKNNAILHNSDYSEWVNKDVRSWELK